MKTFLLVIGIVVTAAGLVWAAQGAGIFPYPAESFMINETRWIWIGLATAVAGVILIALSRQS
ncbi:MAG: hypothetical protein OJF62_002674 [Pseudolabrys sp.]|jgi:hypothetical protein|nr:hypothetical protein [Pseudolabrys sp.]